MGNLGGPEILVILLVALMVLGPNKLPDAARQIGKAVTQLRRMSSGFQQEMRDAMVDPEIEQQARDLGKKLKDPLALKDGLLSNDTPPKAQPTLGADPTPPKAQPALGADPTPPVEADAQDLAADAPKSTDTDSET